MKGESYGGTFLVNWSPISDWRLQLQYTFLELQLHNKPGSLDVSTPQNTEGNSPENQFSVHSFLDLPHDMAFYTGLRFVDNLPAQNINSYIALDACLSWKPIKNMEISIIGQNLTDKSHPEFGTNEIERSVYGKMVWRF